MVWDWFERLTGVPALRQRVRDLEGDLQIEKGKARRLEVELQEAKGKARRLEVELDRMRRRVDEAGARIAHAQRDRSRNEMSRHRMMWRPEACAVDDLDAEFLHHQAADIERDRREIIEVVIPAKEVRVVQYSVPRHPYVTDLEYFESMFCLLQPRISYLLADYLTKKFGETNDIGRRADG